MGRPSDYSLETATIICNRLADGESLRAICLDDGLPDKSTVFRWLIANDSFRDQYARAREAQAEHLVDEILEISDNATNDWMERRSESEKGAGVNSGWVLNGEHVQRSRLRVDSRKWFASKVAPKKYGDKIMTEVTGANGGPLVVGWAKTEADGTSDPSAK